MNHLFKAFLLLSLAGCSTDPIPLDIATIIDSNPGICSCMPGFLMEVDDTTYLFGDVPANSNLDLSNEDLPIDVYVKWKPLEDTCLSICGIALRQQQVAKILYIKKIQNQIPIR